MKDFSCYPNFFGEVRDSLKCLWDYQASSVSLARIEDVIDH